MIDREKIIEVSDDIEKVAEKIEQAIKKEIKPGLELLGQARAQIEYGNTEVARCLLKEAASKFDLGFDDEASSIHGLADDASDCYYDHEEDLQPGYGAGQ